MMLWVDEWQKDIPCFIQCKPDVPGAEAYWWIDYRGGLAAHRQETTSFSAPKDKAKAACI